MKIRSVNELNAYLDNELAWRKRELTTLKFLISESRDHQQECLLRSGICILYAHWEGFIKKATIAYLNFISKQGLDLCELKPNLVALCLRSKYRLAEESKRITIHTEITSLLLSDLRQKAELPWENAVDTKSNLNFDVLRELLCLMGLNYTKYATKEAVIDGKLLNYRNNIAHGEYFKVEPQDYELMHDVVIGLVNLYRNDVENAAIINLFRR